MYNFSFPEKLRMQPERPGHKEEYLKIPRRFNILFAGAIIIWTSVILFSFGFDWVNARTVSWNLALIEAKASFNKDLIYRRWATQHGGVYVPPTEKTPPNPYLKVARRDIVTAEGEPLTLVNPAYMTRQVYEMAEGTFLVKGHITSLKPIRPRNAPDAWETRALHRFEQGAEEISEVGERAGELVLRFMRPMFTEPGCLKCHQEEGYKVGDIRGGISVAVPFSPYLAIEEKHKKLAVFSHLGIWVVGVFLLLLSRNFVSRSYLSVQQSDNKSRAIIHAAPLAMYLLQPGCDGKANNQALALFGIDEQEFRKISPFELSPPTQPDGMSSAEKAEKMLRLVKDDGTQSFEWRHRRKDGSCFDANVSLSHLRFNDEEYYLSIITDITEKKKMTREILYHKEMIDRIVVASPAGLIQTDSSGRVQYINQCARELTGLKKQDVVDSFFNNVNWLSGDRSGEFLGIVNSHSFKDFRGLASPVADEEFSFTRVSGEVGYFSFSASALSDAAGNREGTVIVLADITKRYEAERQYQQLFNSMKDGFALHEIICDEQGVPVDYRFLAVNAAFEKLTGLSCDNIIGKTVYEILPDTEAVWVEKYGTVALFGRSMAFEEYSATLDRYFQVRAFQTKPNQFACIFSDITDRYLAEQQTHELKERFQKVFNSQLDAIFLLGPTVPAPIVECNTSAEGIFGYRADEMIGKTIDFLHVDDAHLKTFRDALRAAIEQNGSLRDFEFVMRRKDGSEFPTEHTVLELTDDAGTRTGWVSVVRDLTDRKELQSQLSQAQKMESVGRLTGGVAHDINNTLGVIMGYAELLEEEVPIEDPIHRYIEQMLDATNRSSKIIRQLLAFSRQQAIAPQILDLNEIVESILKMLRSLIGEDIELFWNPAGDLAMIEMDPAQIDQILANLIVNARDAISDTGCITITTCMERFDESACGKNLDCYPGTFVALTVEDNGCGIQPECRDKIFEPFFTTKAIDKGTGLGLATVYGIVRQNQGFIHVDSELGRGTAFAVYLPAVASGAGAEGVIEPGQSQSDLSGKGETILVVEDDASLLRMTVSMLKRLDYVVLAAGSPVDAKEIIQHHPDIDVLLTDVVMPGMNGRQLWEVLSARNTTMKCLYMSGYTSDVFSQRGGLDEEISFIQKPFSKADIALKLREVIDKK